MSKGFYEKTSRRAFGVICWVILVIISNYDMMHDAIFSSFWNNMLPIILWAVMSLLILGERCYTYSKPRIELTDKGIIIYLGFGAKIEIAYGQIVSASIKEIFFRREVLFIEYKDGVREWPVTTDCPLSILSEKEDFLRKFQEHAEIK